MALFFFAFFLLLDNNTEAQTNYLRKLNQNLNKISIGGVTPWTINDILC